MMKSVFHFLSSRPMAAAFLASMAMFPANARAAGKPVSEFTAEENQKLGWKVVDDGVMGGLSKGNLSFSENGILRFSGELSLENNGGFSSLRTSDLNLDLAGSEGLVIRVKGDGRTYQMRISTDARFRGMEVSFMAGFATKKGEWTEVRVPFASFVGSWRGTMLKDEVFNPAKISRLGLLLGDKKAGPFSMEVDWIRAYSADSANVVDQAVADGRFKTLAAALTAADLVGVLQGDGPFTVFAPTDEAFARLPEGTVENLLKPENKAQLQAILKYHVVPGAVKLAKALEVGEAATVEGGKLAIAFKDGKVLVGKSAILNADIGCTNGVIHVIDEVLLPPAREKEVVANDLIGVAKRAGNFKTLLAAVEAAALAPVLAGEGPFTILAPTDEAFAKLPEGTVGTLLKPENLAQLQAILKYHVFAGKVTAGDALNAKSGTTLNGSKVAFAIKDGVLRANEATIRTTDIQCDNGIIHVIDAVLLPPAPEAGAKGEKTASMEPAERIEAAISRGVPVFNDGDHAQCADIYKTCLETLANDEKVDSEVRKTLGKVLERANGIEDARERAWQLRRGLDYAYHAVAG
jgi:uncharacterized surface protein with fasciclin (FAS1) repeats